MMMSTSHMTSSGDRIRNEDALVVTRGDGFSLLAIADGLGGHRGGGPAARCCIDTVAAAFSHAPGLSEATLQAIADAAARAVFALRQRAGEASNSMLTTLALLAVCDGQARWAHAGDSRIYWFRDGVLMDRTRDHSVAELIAAHTDGPEVLESAASDRNRLLRVVGLAATSQADIGETVVSLRPGDAFLLCSDGFWSMIADEDIASALDASATPDDWRSALEVLLAGAIQRRINESRDDYSLIVGMIMP
jgi:serine/threonine protein phosphatase PrpC